MVSHVCKKCKSFCLTRVIRPTVEVLVPKPKPNEDAKLKTTSNGKDDIVASTKTAIEDEQAITLTIVDGGFQHTRSPGHPRKSTIGILV